MQEDPELVRGLNALNCFRSGPKIAAISEFINMFGICLQLNNNSIAVAGDRALYGLTFGLSMLGCIGRDDSVTEDIAPGHFIINATLDGSKTLGTAQECKMQWIGGDDIGIGDLINLKISEISSPTSSLFAGIPSRADIPFQSRTERKEAGEIVQIRVSVNNETPRIFGEAGVFGIIIMLNMVGFLGPDSIGNQAQRANNITSGWTASLNLTACKGDPKSFTELIWVCEEKLGIDDSVEILLQKTRP